MLNPNIHGDFYEDHPKLMARLSESSGYNVVAVEAKFHGEYYFTPGRIAADPDDSYPEELEDYRELTEVHLYLAEPDEGITYRTTDDIPNDIHELLDELMYDTTAYPLVEPCEEDYYE
jgi:hypothetical protein